VRKADRKSGSRHADGGQNALVAELLRNRSPVKEITKRSGCFCVFGLMQRTKWGTVLPIWDSSSWSCCRNSAETEYLLARITGCDPRGDAPGVFAEDVSLELPKTRSCSRNRSRTRERVLDLRHCNKSGDSWSLFLSRNPSTV